MHNSSVVGTLNLLTDTCNMHCYWFSTKIKIFKADTSVEDAVTNSNLVQLPWNLTGILESQLEFWYLTWNLGISFEILESHLNPVVISSYISVNVCKLARESPTAHLPRARPCVALLFIVVYSVRDSEWESFERIYIL